MIQWFERLLTKSGASDDQRDRIVYAYDGSGIEGQTPLIIWPKDVRHIAHIMLFLRRIGANILIRGSGSSLVGGAVPQGDIVMDLTRFNRVIHLGDQEKTITLEPGVYLKDMNNLLKRYNLEFPIKPRNYKITTIGGLIATNALDSRSKKKGRAKDWIEYIEIIDGTGRLVKVDSDNLKFFCGREGTSGIIVKAKLKLAEINEDESASIEGFEYIEELTAKAEELSRREDVISVDYLDPYSSDILGLEPRYTLITCYSNKESGEITSKKELKDMRDKINELGFKFATRDYIYDFDAKIPEEKLTRFLNWLRENKIISSGYADQGMIHCYLKEETKGKADMFYEFVKSIGGDITGEYGVGLTKKKYVDEDYKNKIKVLKEKYDPGNVLNRGKII